MIRALLEKHTLTELAGNPHWGKLIELYQIMEEFLPEGYSEIMDHVDPIPNARRQLFTKQNSARNILLTMKDNT